MRIKLTQPILNYEGNPIMAPKTNPDGSPALDENHRQIQEPETLRSYLVMVLNNKTQTETEPMGVEEAAKRYQLTNKLYAKNEVDLGITEAALLKARVDAIYCDSPLILGRITDLLEGQTVVVPESPLPSEAASGK